VYRKETLTRDANQPDKPAPEPAPTASAAAEVAEGVLVAVAVGGKCAFSVNGESKGTSSTLKISVKPGTYSITCAPASGASGSKTVTVSSGGTAMAMFKL
jgi:serine/threonine-protein kinase